MKLSPIQLRVLKILKHHNISFSPGDSIWGRFEGQDVLIHRRTIKSLKKLGLVDHFDLHPWGPNPVYGIYSTDKGKRYEIHS